ncbi:hypothetical protein Clacol_007233 [Clathrus columnatus]|uniref:Uncharacterized protein n=1 Tax=Clathrus columnatus TaxID=1419009 RepID=A0AAV5AJ73_9AGAM|nr:hypothetical protein Clacol_007233 [Clathrus columnatus]
MVSSRLSINTSSVLRKILEESPASNTTFSAITDLPSDDSHKHNRVKATKTSHKRKPRKDKDGKLYPVGPRDVARLLLKDEHQAQQMKRIFEQTAERLDIESKRAIEAERRAREAEDRMLQMLDTTRDAQRELLRERDLLRAYQSQVEAAKNEILKAQKELDTLAEEKYKVEQEAAQERSRYRQLHKEVEVKEALNRGRLEGFMDGRKEGWQLGKDYARGKVRVWRDAEYYSEGEESASIFTTTDAPDPPPLNGYRLGQTRSNAQAGQTQTGQAPVTMPVPDTRSDLPAKNLPRTATPHGNRRVVNAMQSPKSRTSGRSHRRNSTITMPIPNPAPATGPGPSSLRQNTLSTEDDVSIKSPRVYSTKTPLRPPSVRAPSTRPDTASRGRTPVNQIPTPTSPQASQRSQPIQQAEFSQPSQSVPSFEQSQTNVLPPIRPIPSPHPRSPSHSPINPLPGGFIPVLEEGRISLPPPHEVDPFPPSPSAPQNRLFDTTGHQHHQSVQQSAPPTVNVTVNAYSAQPQQPPEENTFTFPVPDPDPPPPPTREFSIPVPDIAPIRQSPAQMNYSHFQNSPSRRSPRLERRSPRTPVGNISESPIGALNHEIDGLNLAAELFETDENGNVPGTIGYVPPRGSTWRPLSAIPEGGSTAAESPAPERIRSRNPSAASFRNQVPKFPQFPGNSMLNKPQPPIPPRSPSILTHSPISPHSPLPNLELINEHGILNDPMEYAEFTDIPNNFVTPSRQQLAEHLRPAPDIEQILDDVSPVKTSRIRALFRRKP